MLTVPEYADEVFKNEKLRAEVKRNDSESTTKPIGKFWMPDWEYMTKQTDINEKMRKILVDWLLKVHSKFKLLPETLYLTVNIIDRYLSHELVNRKILQLVGVTSMHIACKYEEIYPPEANDFVYITDNAYTKKELLDMEYKILKTLNFNLTYASAYRHLERFCTVTNWEHLLSNANKLMNSSLMEYSMIKYEPIVLAAGGLYLAYAIEKKSMQKKTHQNSMQNLSQHSLKLKTKDHSSFDSSTNILPQLCREAERSEAELKKCAIDINMYRLQNKQVN